MSDFGVRRDLQNVSAFTDADAEFDFGFAASFQAIINESEVVMELSWDGQNIDATLDPAATTVLTYDDHLRTKVFVRRQSGAGGQPHRVQVLAGTR